MNGPNHIVSIIDVNRLVSNGGPVADGLRFTTYGKSVSTGEWASGMIFETSAPQLGWAEIPPRGSVRTVPPALIQVDDALVTGKGPVVMPGGTVLVGSSLVPDAGKLQNLLKALLEAGLERHDPERIPTACLLSHPGGDVIYGHWLLDLLPKAELARDHVPEDVPFLVGKDIPEFAVGLLERIGIPRERLLRRLPRMSRFIVAEECLKVQKLYIPTSARNNLFFDPSRCGVYEHLLSQAPLRPKIRAERIFLSRSALTRNKGLKSDRKLENAAAVERVFSDMGFTVIQPEKLPFPEQIALFANAKVIAGEDGSALHNALWCKPESTMVCLSSPRRLNRLHFCVAETRRLHYRLVRGAIDQSVLDGLEQGTVSNEDAYFAPWAVDPIQLGDALAGRVFS
ncbi:glycosyltransferase family 61 protein [Pseudodesulfovibrio indicus]|uniref:glycosyltransferase family 61 protein n=1 Tax=Pseudodesulfovibrio indicus TaxID=1716143 RepID=UPI00292E3DE0|nr:glycosyltransferase family 61 protein [Pseudodesulfovibrio indicus]